MQILQVLNILNFTIPVIWLIAIFIHWLKFGEIKFRWIKAGIFTILALFIITGAYSSLATYDLWKADPLSRYLLPPHTSISYFLGYAFFQII